MRHSRGSFQYIAIVGVFLSVVCWNAHAQAAEVVRRCWSMGAWVDVAVEARERGIASAAAEATVRAIESADRRLSTWRDDSELSLFNSSDPGVWVTMSSELSHDLRQAVQCFRSTGGAFNPGMAELVRLWDLRGQGRVPSDAEVDVAVDHSRLDCCELQETRARRCTPRFGIEEGGFGKGVALRDGAEAALRNGADCVRLNFGGQTHSEGDCDPRQVHIAHPEDRDAVIATLSMGVGSTSTSGNSERRITVDGQRVGHLLDPSTGAPAPDFGSVTVMARDPVTADCVATALFVMGPKRGVDWLEKNRDIEALFAIVGADGVHLLASDSVLAHPAVSAGAFDGPDRLVMTAMEPVRMASP